jgi:hypothetical protein
MNSASNPPQARDFGDEARAGVQTCLTNMHSIGWQDGQAQGYLQGFRSGALHGILLGLLLGAVLVFFSLQAGLLSRVVV